MKQFIYVFHPKDTIHSIIAEDLKDAIYRAGKLHRCKYSQIELIESKEVTFEPTPSKKNYGRFKKGK